MWSKKEIIIFFAGAAAFHTFSHIMLIIFGMLPLQVMGINFTQQLNLYIIILSTLVTLGLIYWANQEKGK